MSGWAAAAQAGAQLVDTGLQVWSAHQANKTNREIAAKQIAFQEKSAKSRYQWTMEDMRKAGLNPMLAYSQGGGSSLPGASTTVTPVYKGSGAKEAVRGYQEMKLAQQQLKNMKAEEVRIFEDAMTRTADYHKKQAETDVLRTQSDIQKEVLTSAKAQATYDKIQQEMFEKYPILRQLDVIGRSLNPFVSAGSSAKKIATD